MDVRLWQELSQLQSLAKGVQRRAFSLPAQTTQRAEIVQQVRGVALALSFRRKPMGPIRQTEFTVPSMLVILNGISNT